MQLDVVDEKENKFFNRKDLMVKIKHAGTATTSKAELVKELTERYKVDATQVIVDYIFTMHGLSESTAKVKILNEKPKESEKAKVEEKKDEGEKVEAQTGKSE